jgi:hypothetical protein
MPSTKIVSYKLLTYGKEQGARCKVQGGWVVPCTLFLVPFPLFLSVEFFLKDPSNLVDGAFFEVGPSFEFFS